MKPSSNKNAANQHTSNPNEHNQSTNRGTSSFSSKVPRFPSEKVAVGPSPGQYDPVVKEKIKGVVPLSKQLPRTKDSAIPGETSSRMASNPCSNHSSAASFHSTREPSSSGSTLGSSKTVSHAPSTKSSLHAPFAPLKRTGIVKTASSDEAAARPRHSTSTYRAQTPDGKMAPNKPAHRLTSGNHVPGSTVVKKTLPRPATAGANTPTTNVANLKTGTRASSATPGPKSRSRSSSERGAGSSRRTTTSVSPSSIRSSISPLKREQLAIKKELNELMARKLAQNGSGSNSETETTKQPEQRCSNSSMLSPRSSQTCSTPTSSPVLSRSSSSTAGSSSQDVSVYQSTLWSSSPSSHTSLVAEEVEMETRIRRLSTNSNQSDRTTTSWLEKDRTQTANLSPMQKVDSVHAMPEEFSSLTYIKGDEPLRTPLMSCVRRYFASPPAAPHSDDEEELPPPLPTAEDDAAVLAEEDSEPSLYDLAYAPPPPAEDATLLSSSSSSYGLGFVPPLPMDFKPFLEVPADDAYVSNMFEVFTAGLVATNAPNPHIGDHKMGGFHAVPSDLRHSKEMTCQPIMEVTEPSAPSTISSVGKPVKSHKKESPLHSRQTLRKPGADAMTTSPKNAALKPRTVITKAKMAKSPKRVNETESFSKAEMKRKCSINAVHSFTTPEPDAPQSKPAFKEAVRSKLGKLGPPSYPRRARTLDVVERNKDNGRVISKPRCSSAPTEAPMSVEDAEVEISSTSYEEDTHSSHRHLAMDRQKTDKEDGRKSRNGGSVKSGNSSCGFDIDVVCSENNLTIIAKEKRGSKVEKPKSRKSVAKSRIIDPIPAVKSIAVASKQKEPKSSQMKTVLSEFRSSAEKKTRPKSSPRSSVNSKCKSSTRSSSFCGSETSRQLVKIREGDPIKTDQSHASSDQHSSRLSPTHSLTPSRSCCSRPSSGGGHAKDVTEKLSAVNVPPPTITKSDPARFSGNRSQRGKITEGEGNTKYDVQLPKLADDMETSGNKPANQYVKDSITLLDVIPQTAQKISESFHKMLEGMRAYLTDTPYVNLKRNELQEHLLTYINEADGNAFYIRQEVKTELHRCVTQINANLQELLYLNNCAHEERQIAQKRIEELHAREEQLSNGMEEFRRLNEGVLKQCDDWAYKCRKEQETRRFIEGSKELVEKEVVKQRKELREAEDEVARLRREIKDFDKKLDELKKSMLLRDTKFMAKIKMEEKTSQMNIEMLAKAKDEKTAMQRTLHQMNESHIRLNNQNMAKIQLLEKQLKEADVLLESAREDKSKLEQQLVKKDDYLKLVEGAAVNLVRQTNPGRELPSMPEEFGLNEREISVWEQLNLCRGRLADLETETLALKQERLMLIEKINDTERMYQWVQENEGLLKATQNEFTILEQPNAELVEEMEQMRAENKDLKERLAAREKHCSLAHEKIEKLQDLLNSLRISETEDADRVEVATLQHQVAEMKSSMREMLERTKELDLRCASQEIQLKQRDYYAHNQQRLLETRNKVIEVLKVKGRDVSTIESLMGFGDTWQKSSEPRLSLSGTSEASGLSRSPSQLAKNELRIRELEELVLKLEHDESHNHEQRVRLENTIAELELKLLKAERAKYYRTSNSCLPT